MDAEILQKQIALLQEQLLSLDTRVDTLVSDPPSGNGSTEAYEARLTVLEEAHRSCEEQLKGLLEAQTSLIEAETEQIEAETEQIEATTDLIQSMPEPSDVEPEETDLTEEGVTEVMEEPESESDESDEPRPKWWESFLTLR